MFIIEPDTPFIDNTSFSSVRVDIPSGDRHCVSHAVYGRATGWTQSSCPHHPSPHLPQSLGQIQPCASWTNR